jgi:hypothetical protein
MSYLTRPLAMRQMQVRQVPFLQELGSAIPDCLAASSSDTASVASNCHPFGSITMEKRRVVTHMNLLSSRQRMSRLIAHSNCWGEEALRPVQDQATGHSEWL